MKDGKKVVHHIFITVVLIFILPIMFYFWADRFKNPEFHASIKLDYDEKQAELQKILDTMTIGLPLFDKRDDYKKVSAKSISITYHCYNPKISDIEIFIQKISDTELSAHDNSSHSFYRQFCVGENEISIGDYNFDDLYHVRLYVGFSKHGDCRRWVYKNGEKNKNLAV